MKNLNKLFNPKSVAIVGASQQESKVGYAILNNLISAKFDGNIYPVNPNADMILGVKVYRDLRDIDEEIDLAVFIIPPKFIAQTIEENRKKIKSVIVISAGFKETGIEGQKLEDQLKKVVSENKIPTLGPNCLGLISCESKLNVSFAADMPQRGNIAFMSQSGALCTAVLDWAVKRKIGFSKFISLGNETDLDETDIIEFLSNDPETKVITGYVEGISNGKKFIEVISEVAKKKPVILTKGGTTAAGARAASSHTGSLAGSFSAYEAAFKQSGIIFAKSIQELFDFSLSFSYQPIPAGPNIAIITNAGGPGIISSDAVEKSELKMAKFDSEMINKLKENLPPTAATDNPVDVIGDADSVRYAKSIELVLKSSNVDSCLVISTPQAMTQIKETASMICELSKKSSKPIIASFMGGHQVEAGIEILNDGHVPNYTYPERAVASLDAMYRYKKTKDKKIVPSKFYTSKKENASKIIGKSKKEARLPARQVGETDAKKILECYGFRTPKSILIADENDLAKAVKETGFPIVMKISSPDILHKSDAGGVKVGIKDEKEAVEAFKTIIANVKKYNPDARIEGMLVQEMIVDGKQVILGVSKDAQFGHMIMFGLGGIYVEVLKDVSFRIAPLSETDAREMISEIKTYKILTGVRGEESVDIEAIVDSLLRLSKLVTDFPQISELDINPLSVMPKSKGGAVALDARIALEG